MVAWALHELDAAVDKAGKGSFTKKSGAPHNWDEVWAYYHGEKPECSPFATAQAREQEFGVGTLITRRLQLFAKDGLKALVDKKAPAARDGPGTAGARHHDQLCAVHDPGGIEDRRGDRPGQDRGGPGPPGRRLGLLPGDRAAHRQVEHHRCRRPSPASSIWRRSRLPVLPPRSPPPSAPPTGRSGSRLRTSGHSRVMAVRPRLMKLAVRTANPKTAS